MFHDGATARHIEMRQRRRFQIPGRVYLGYALAGLEGLVAAAIGLAMSVLSPEPMAWDGQFAWLAFAALGAIYAAFSHSAIAGYLASDRGHPKPMMAAVHWLVSLSLVWLASMLIAGSYAPLGHKTWQWLLIGAVILMLVRWTLYRQLRTMMTAGQLQMERTALVGSADSIRQFEREAKIWQHGAQVIAKRVLDRDAAGTDAASFSAFVQTCTERHCDHVLFLDGLDGSDAATALLDACRPYAINVAFAPPRQHDRLLEILGVGPGNTIAVVRKPLTDGDRILKRSLDLFGAIIALVVFSPVLLAVALLVKSTSPGPVFYRQERRGFSGKSFYILKFRSMTVMEDGRAMTPAVQKDHRLTKVGGFLRRTSIDELPQLLNVLQGTMSLVGPRPHAISHDAELSRSFALYAQRQRIKPGITGWAQVNGFRGEITTQAQIEGRTKHDIAYAENWSLGLDIKILLLTFFSRQTHRRAF
ncbi:MAG: exopolysaccharide biosynthesis polyprenyl glycosylphosphotransferase [Alphaproteobacteria bacterium]|nr:exopolysaccharide biosynthesis polyprenyl glycosylphosphotransferase [Alphaproteobacteria bacterium]